MRLVVDARPTVLKIGLVLAAEAIGFVGLSTLSLWLVACRINERLKR